MLTRLRIDGFKNLVDVDLRFGPFTCIAGVNGVGKSNVFDAICFLGDLADLTFVKAASNVRADGEGGASLRGLFFRSGDVHRETMRFECEFVVPRVGEDDLGQPAVATSTFLRYTVELRYRRDELMGSEGIELVSEELSYIRKGAVMEHLPFLRREQAEWADSVFVQGRTGGPFISTVEEEGERHVKLHQDGRSSAGKSRRGRVTSTLLAERLPKTVLSSTTASESPTALLARQELRSWRRLQLEASAMRRPDGFDAPSRMDVDGAHMAKALFALAATARLSGRDLYAELGGRLAELVNDVREVRVESDPKREVLTLSVSGRDGVSHPARSLSDGTLRFLALCVLELLEIPEVVCLEEPENGIHPTRIETMMRLLLDIAVDPSFPVAEDNPLRQVIVNTHSPGIVKASPVESLIVAETARVRDRSTGEVVTAARFRAMPGTWRHEADSDTMPVFLLDLLGYLEYLPRDGTESDVDENVRTVVRRHEKQLRLAVD